MTKPSLVLYYFASCPFCIKVLRYMQDFEIDIPKRDTLIEPGAKEELMSIGGKTQVPCLVIDGEALYESDEIIRWFQDNWEDEWSTQ